MDKIKVAILFGGCSEEHDVSVKSAKEIADNIDTEKYEPIYVGITKSGVWKMCEKPHAEWENEKCCPAVISPDRETHGLIIFQDGIYKACHIDSVFPVLHGKMGEDGAMQGLLELSGIPYVGCDVQSSAMCMDKSLTYMTVKNAGIAIPEFQVLNHGNTPNENSYTYPVFVKPARSGSSFGVTKVNRENELVTAIELAKQGQLSVSGFMFYA